MLTIYGTKLCPDCVQCLADLDAAGVPYEYLDFFDDLRNLKAFLKLRDSSQIFNDAKENGNIGIPMPLNIISIFKPNTQDELSYGELGEICIYSPGNMLGYDDPVKTAQTLRDTLNILDKMERLFTDGMKEAGERVRTAETVTRIQ